MVKSADRHLCHNIKSNLIFVGIYLMFDLLGEILRVVELLDMLRDVFMLVITVSVAVAVMATITASGRAARSSPIRL